MARTTSHPEKKKRALLRGLLLLCLSGTAILPAQNTLAQQVNKMGVSPAEKRGTQIGLPNILNKQDAKGPAMTYQRVSREESKKEDIGETPETETGEEQVKKTENKDEKSEKKETETAKAGIPEEPKEKAEEPVKQSKVYKNLGTMGVNADSMKQAVFLRHERISKNDE